jgi:DNA-binding transcriptional LysR family regulator
MSISLVKESLGWDELRLFLAVARAEGLSGAARRTGVSAPTLGRRITALEQRLDRKLFERRQTGNSLTDAGHELYGRALDKEMVAGEVERWRDRNARRIVRISAGSWTSRFLARHIAELLKPDEPIGIDLATGHARVDISHRHADIGVRNRAPDEARLAGRRIQNVAHCVYRGRLSADGDLPWIRVTGDAAVTPSARWVSANHGDQPALICSDARVVLDLVRAGAGQAVLPCFVGDEAGDLVRSGAPVEELADEQWLVLNEQARHEPAVRTVIGRLVALLGEHKALFEGKRPSPRVDVD